MEAICIIFLGFVIPQLLCINCVILFSMWHSRKWGKLVCVRSTCGRAMRFSSLRWEDCGGRRKKRGVNVSDSRVSDFLLLYSQLRSIPPDDQQQRFSASRNNRRWRIHISPQLSQLLLRTKKISEQRQKNSLAVVQLANSYSQTVWFLKAMLRHPRRYLHAFLPEDKYLRLYWGESVPARPLWLE